MQPGDGSIQYMALATYDSVTRDGFRHGTNYYFRKVRLLGRVLALRGIAAFCLGLAI